MKQNPRNGRAGRAPKAGPALKNAGKKHVRRETFPIVALGTSAGGLEALERFFHSVPEKTGLAYVIVMHLSSEHDSILTDLVKKFTPMPVSTIIDCVSVSPNVVYVIPPGKNVEIHEGVLRLLKQNEPHYINLPVDAFFCSLAAERGKSAVAVILSGTGTDGTRGAREIKSKGGIVVAQDPKSAKFDGMPVSVINTGVVDFISFPENIPVKLLKWLRQSGKNEEKLLSELGHIFSIIRAKTGHDFSLYKSNTICRRIEKQMHEHHIETISEYIPILAADTTEVKNLVRGFLIGVTQFFRDPDAFSVLEKKVLPEIFDGKPQDYCIRIWVPGCSSGEEVYSIAILIYEYMRASKLRRDVQIFGTDIDSSALAIARSGKYSATITADVSQERLSLYFTENNGTYRIKSEIRNMVIFGEQNITKDPPFTRVDMISCRNLLIYLDINLQKKIFPIFHYSLRPGGILFLGMSESIGNFEGLFVSVNRNAKIYRRKETLSSRRAILNYPHIQYENDIGTRFTGEKKMMTTGPEFDAALSKFFLDRFTPSCIIVDQDGHILYVHGNLSHYLRTDSLNEMPALSNITDVAHHSIRNILKSVVSTAGSRKKNMFYRDLQVKHKDELHIIDLEIVFLSAPKPLAELILVIFSENTGSALERSHSEQGDAGAKDTVILRLENDLRHTRENLQASIEELESSNEELQSMNEELQSTNEEIETSREELNSLNEELVVTNTELQARLDQLVCVHDDMANLFNSTEVAIIFLDNNLCIKRFTPSAQNIIHLISADIGRSVSHFSTTLKYDGLVEDASEVLRTLVSKTMELQTKINNWLLVRILPYRTLANVIDGVVITLTDITAQKEFQATLDKVNSELEAALQCSKNIFDAIPLPVMVLSENLMVTFSNRAFSRVFGTAIGDMLNQHISDIKLFSELALEKALVQEHTFKKLFSGFEIEKEFHFLGFKSLKVHISKIFNREHGRDVFMLTMEPK